MPNTIQALGIFLILLPGFTCAYIAQQLAVRPKQTEFDKAVEALLFSLVLYVAVGPLFHYALPVGWQETVSGHPGIYVAVVRWKELATLAGAAVLLGVLFAANVNHDWILSLLRALHVTERTSRTSIWSDTFQDIVGGTTVQVVLGDGRTVSGWVHYYSDDPKDASLFLEEAEWIDEEGRKIPIPGPGILLLPQAGIQYVMFLDPETTDDPEDSPGKAR